MTEHARTASYERTAKQRMRDALRPFGWTCGPEFWRRYHSDPWVFNLANAVEALSEKLAQNGGTGAERYFDERMKDPECQVAYEAAKRLSLDARHQEHYRFCNCLGDSSECCEPDCECHADSARSGA